MKKKKSSKKSTSKNLVSSRNIIIALVVVILAIAVFNMGPSNKEEGLGQGGPGGPWFSDIGDFIDDIIEFFTEVPEECDPTKNIYPTGNNEDCSEPTPVCYSFLFNGEHSEIKCAECVSNNHCVTSGRGRYCSSGDCVQSEYSSGT